MNPGKSYTLTRNGEKRLFLTVIDSFVRFNPFGKLNAELKITFSVGVTVIPPGVLKLNRRVTLAALILEHHLRDYPAELENSLIPWLNRLISEMNLDPGRGHG